MQLILTTILWNRHYSIHITAAETPEALQHDYYESDPGLTPRPHGPNSNVPPSIPDQNAAGLHSQLALTSLLYSRVSWSSFAKFFPRIAVHLGFAHWNSYHVHLFGKNVHLCVDD